MEISRFPGSSVATVPAAAALPVVRPFDQAIAEHWDRFVKSQATGSFFMLSGWKRVIENTFGYRSCYCYVARDNEITAVAPLFLVSNWVVGRCLISVPFGVYGGICAQDPESAQILLEHLKRYAAEAGVDYLELRARGGPLFEDFYANSLYATFTTPLSKDIEANLKRLPKDTRYMIRKAQKAGLEAHHGWEQLEDFYPLFANNLRNHGTPAIPRDLLDHLAEEFRDSLDLMMVYCGSKPVAGVISFIFGDTIMPYYAGTSPKTGRLAANNFMYWEVIKSAAEAGIRTFDFGRSKRGTGSFAFKTQWNMSLEPLNYQTHLIKRKTVPNFSPLNPKFQLAARIWRRLPLQFTITVGPRVVRWFP
jgi:FemAB-related protein (PEP-CTERM system-associated)